MIPISSLCLLLLLPVSLAYPGFQDKIPNGKNLLHPCIPGYRWPGVGHENRNGGGVRNPFGLAFAAAGYQWTKSLCQLDSDGDGKTNGEELGDPTCVWSANLTPDRSVNLTHPGVCEPMSSAECQGKNNFVSCDLDSFDQCDVAKNADVVKVDLRFPTFSVPATETNYMCMTFDLPRDKDYHIVADQPIINNSNVVHHMVLYGCDDANDTYIPSPRDCGMSNTACFAIIASWAVGETGACMGETYGFRIGATSYKRVVLETHYNNPTLKATYKDSSGIRLYIRPARPEVQDLFIFLTGQMLLELPPGQTKVEKVGVCKGSCTSLLLKEPVYLINVANHMHYYGSAIKIDLYRNGVLVKTLANDEDYDMDSPKDYDLDPPVKIYPGDEIVTRCTYDTTSTDEWVYYGESTSDEMCYGYLTAFPKQALKTTGSSCESVSTLSYCEMQQGTPLSGCDWNTLLDSEDVPYQNLESAVTAKCTLDGVCKPACKDLVANLAASTCFKGEAGKVFQGLLACSDGGSAILERLSSCPWPNGVNVIPDLCGVDYGDW